MLTWRIFALLGFFAALTAGAEEQRGIDWQPWSDKVFEQAAAFVNDVGLLAEEADPVSGELLGNFPQAFSHIGLVNAAWAISEAERQQGSPAGAPDTSP